MLTLAGKFGLTAMEIAFETAGLPVAQTALEVISQVTLSPLANVLLLYALLLPTTIPFIFH